MKLSRPMEWQLLLHQAVRPFLRRLATGAWRNAFTRLPGEVGAIARHRLWPIEQRQFVGHMATIAAQRDRLFLQADLSRSLRAFAPRLAGSPLSSKLRFAEFCQRSGLPHPPVMPLYTPPEEHAVLARLGPALFVKPDRGSSGKGTALLRRLDDGTWVLADEQGTFAGTFVATLGRIDRTPRRLLQPLLRGPAMPGAPDDFPPITFRIITGASGGRPSILAILAQLARDDTLPLSARWLNLPMDPATGRYAPPEPAAFTGAVGVFDPWVRQVAQIALPQASAATATALAAHNCLIEEMAGLLPPMVGWDLALTGEGPVLLEGNWNWGVAAHYITAAGLDLSPSDTFSRLAARAARGRDQ